MPIPRFRIESVVDCGDAVTVETTGARYVFERGERLRISCHQRINTERLVARLTLSIPADTFLVEHDDVNEVVLRQRTTDTWYTRLVVRADSVLDIYSMTEIGVTVEGAFRPAYVALKAPHAILADEHGGVGCYGVRGMTLDAGGIYTTSQWKHSYRGERFSRMLVSVFPPRPFQLERSLSDRIAHWGVNPPWTFGHYPSDAMIAEAAPYANILVLHDQIWHGQRTVRGLPMDTTEDLLADAAYCSYDWVPVDESELRRVVRTAHAHGMRVLPYLSPTFTMAPMDHLLDETERVLDEYRFDGVYYDGLTFDLVQAYDLMRGARALLGDRILYLHTTYEPFGSREVIAPFLDTYADFVLRGEHPSDFAEEAYIRYVLCSQSTSNAIAHVCHCYYPPEFVEGILDTVLANEGRFYLALPQTENEAILKRDYYPRLDERRRELTLNPDAS
ncbi:MAG: hypothetical protein J7M15_04340 [Anaerolineae bacterium]|nr:hypothetical protein [Anaerolineae bacterium]